KREPDPFSFAFPRGPALPSPHPFHMRTLSAVWMLMGLGSFLSSPHSSWAAGPPELRVLFLGDAGHHRPADRFKQLLPILASHRIELVYTERLEDLNPAKLAGFDVLA